MATRKKLIAAPRVKKPTPFAFVLDELESVDPTTRPMFGCIAIYVGDKIMLVLREREDETQDNGVWLATAVEHHESLRKEFPSMRHIEVFGTPVTAWQVLPASALDFEESVLRACELIRARDLRIGKLPKKKTPRTPKKPKPRKRTPRTK